ncbi:MAG: hypothetical protein WCI05_04735, partial [Myxococcales bacterium]
MRYRRGIIVLLNVDWFTIAPVRVVALLLGSFVVACGAPTVPRPLADEEGTGILHTNAAPANDPTVLGARVVPESFSDSAGYGQQPGGGARGIVAGMRVARFARGGVLASPDRLPPPSAITFLPPHLGHGVLFSVGNTLWRSDDWIHEAKPLLTGIPGHLFVGLDRVYVRGSTGRVTGLDPHTGKLLDLGPWPRSPWVASYAAADGWRALAIADLQGAVATFDAGASWHALDLPITPREARADAGRLFVVGMDAGSRPAAFEIRDDGSVTRIDSSPTSRPSASPHRTAAVAGEAERVFGARPLVAAIEDGWPLSDATAVVARDGMLARIRLSDGALLEAVPRAFALSPARCHPVPFGIAPAFAFICGEPHGRTVIFAFERGRLIPYGRFAHPRAVISSGNGLLAVHGSCNEQDPDTGEPRFCLFDHRGTWRELVVKGDFVDDRLVLLGDGRLVFVTPPQGVLAAARVTVLDGAGQLRSVPLRFPKLSGDLERALRLGVWLDGFEERPVGQVSGWVEGSGSLLGVRITLNGDVTLGRFLRDAGNPMVSGRYGLGWLASRRGYETTDGGFTWNDIELPEPLAAGRAIRSRACGPIGCTAAGWLRVGWGVPEPLPKPEPPPALPTVTAPLSPPFELTCTVEPTPTLPAIAPAGPVKPLAGYLPYGGYTVATGLRELPAFLGRPAPRLGDDHLGLAADISGSAGMLGRVYTWGPYLGPWELDGHMALRWVWPFGAQSDVRLSGSMRALYEDLEAAKRGLGAANWSLLADGPHHGLLLARQAPVVRVYGLEPGRAPSELRRMDGAPFGEIQGATRVDGHWVLLTANGPGELAA